MTKRFEHVTDHLKKKAGAAPASGIAAQYVCTAALVWAIGELVEAVENKVVIVDDEDRP